jgi:hypothetical protein
VLAVATRGDEEAKVLEELITAQGGKDVRHQ